MQKEIFLQGKFTKNSNLNVIVFRITNIGYLDKRINRIKKVKKHKNLLRNSKFLAVHRKEGGYNLYFNTTLIGSIIKAITKRGWWKLLE